MDNEVNDIHVIRTMGNIASMCSFIANFCTYYWFIFVAIFFVLNVVPDTFGLENEHMDINMFP